MQLTPYVLMQSQRFVLSSFDDPKVQSFFKKFPNQPGKVNTKLVGVPLNEQQLDEYTQFMEKHLRKKMIAAFCDIRLPYTYERIDELLLLVKQSEILASSKQEITQLGLWLVEKARAMMIDYF